MPGSSSTEDTEFNALIDSAQPQDKSVYYTLLVHVAGEKKEEEGGGGRAFGDFGVAAFSDTGKLEGFYRQVSRATSLCHFTATTCHVPRATSLTRHPLVFSSLPPDLVGLWS